MKPSLTVRVWMVNPTAAKPCTAVTGNTVGLISSAMRYRRAGKMKWVVSKSHVRLGKTTVVPVLNAGASSTVDPPPVCEAEPSCAPNEQESLEACAMNEADCRSETLCGATVYCRPVGEGLLALPDCDEVELLVDPFSIVSARIDGDILHMIMTASGGCADHIFMGCHRAVAPAEPIQFNIFIGHDSNDDACEGMVMQAVRFDLRILRDIYLAFVNADSGQVSLFISDYAPPLVYRF